MNRQCGMTSWSFWINAKYQRHPHPNTSTSNSFAQNATVKAESKALEQPTH
jgi:hypothetical protein